MMKSLSSCNTSLSQKDIYKMIGGLQCTVTIQQKGIQENGNTDDCMTSVQVTNTSQLAVVHVWHRYNATHRQGKVGIGRRSTPYLRGV